MLISAIKAQKRRANRVNVSLDGRFAFGLAAKVAERFGLKVGMELTAADVERIMLGQVLQDCVDKALEYLSRRMHSRKELTQKLTRAEYAPATIEAALSKLEGLGYVNDEEYARQKLQQAQRRLVGERRAMAELLRSGVKGQTAREAVREHFSADEAKENAQKLIEKNLPRLQRLDAAVAKRRLIGLLQRRGFDYETARPMVERALGRVEEE